MTVQQYMFFPGRQVAVSLTAVLFLAAAPCAIARAADVQDGQAARIGQICASALRGAFGEAHHAGRVESLSQSARRCCQSNPNSSPLGAERAGGDLTSGYDRPPLNPGG